MRLRDVSKILNYNKEKKVLDRKVEYSRRVKSIRDDWDKDVNVSKNTSFPVILLFASFIFLLFAILISFFIKTAGIDNSISNEKITVVVQGPNIVDSGKNIPFTIRVANRNPISLRTVKISVNYPEGAYIYNDAGGYTEASVDEFTLGEIETGGISEKKINTLFFGSEDEIKKIDYKVEYRTDTSFSTFSVKGSHEITLRSSPILLSKPKSSTVVNGKKVNFFVNFRSNTDKVLPYARVKLNYPPGFIPELSSVNPSDENKTEFLFKNINPGEEKKINLSGVIRGEENTEQAIIARVFATPLNNEKSVVEVAKENLVFDVGKTFVNANLRFATGRSIQKNFGTNSVIAPQSNAVIYVDWENEDRDVLEDVVITAYVRGTGLNESSIRVNGGRFDGERRLIVWDKISNPSLRSVSSGKSGTVSFSFLTVPDRIEFAGENKIINIDISITAKRISTGEFDSVQSIASGEIRLSTVLNFIANTSYRNSTIKNIGPIPPKVGEQTSYTASYLLNNSGNTLNNLYLEIPLSQFATFSGKYSGIAESEISYDKENKLIKINIQRLDGSGARSSRKIELQLFIQPTIQQVGGPIVLTKESIFMAEDRFVDKKIERKIQSLNTSVTGEPIEKSNGIVSE